MLRVVGVVDRLVGIGSLRVLIFKIPRAAEVELIQLHIAQSRSGQGLIAGLRLRAIDQVFVALRAEVRLRAIGIDSDIGDVNNTGWHRRSRQSKYRRAL